MKDINLNNYVIQPPPVLLSSETVRAPGLEGAPLLSCPGLPRPRRWILETHRLNLDVPSWSMDVPSWSKYKREMPSRLVIACNNGAGCVLYAIGSCWEAWYEGSGSHRLDDNGLDDAPDGISIWEGHMHSWGPDFDGEYDAELRGEFRNLTESEWKLLAEGQAPWDEKEWIEDREDVVPLARETTMTHHKIEIK